MRFDKNTVFSAAAIAALTGPFLFLPAISLVGTMLAPSQPTPAAMHAPSLLGEAIWARARGGRSQQLQPLNPFTIGRAVSCMVLAERLEPSPERDRRQTECMELLPALEAVGYLSSEHMRRVGVWQDPRVPFVQLANMNKLTSTWTREQVIDTLAERGEYILGWRGADAAAHGFFNRSAAELTVPQAALVAALLGNTRLDPWCSPAVAARARERVLDRMHANQVIDDAAFQSANTAELALIAPPPAHKACGG